MNDERDNRAHAERLEQMSNGFGFGRGIDYECRFCAADLPDEKRGGYCDEHCATADERLRTKREGRGNLMRVAIKPTFRIGDLVRWEEESRWVVGHVVAVNGSTLTLRDTRGFKRPWPAKLVSHWSSNDSANGGNDK